MFNVSDAHHFRKMVAGICMVLAPLFLLASAVVSPRLDSHELAQARIITEHLDRWYLSNLLGLISLVLVVPAILGFMHMLRERQTAWGHLGGGFSIVGVIGNTAATGMAFVVWLMSDAGFSQLQIADVLHRMSNTAGIVVPVLVAACGIAVGFSLLAVGMWRARVVHWSQALCVAAGGIALTVGFAVFSLTLIIVAAAVLLVGFASIGQIVLTESDEDWEHTPEFRGFRPAAGTR